MDEKVIEEAERLYKKFGGNARYLPEEFIRIDNGDRFFWQDVKKCILDLEDIDHKKFVNNLWKNE